MTRPLALLLTAVLLQVAQTPTDLLNKIDQTVKDLRTLLAPPPPTTAIVTTAAALDAALAGPDPVLTLSATLVYPAELTLRRSVTLQSVVPLARMTRGVPLPSFQGGLHVDADHVTLIGIEVTHPNPLTDIVTVAGAHDTLDRLRILGDPAKGAKRCLATNSNGDLKVLRSYVADCFQASPGNDSQAIGGWDMGPGLLAEDNYFEGGSETILFGGADAPEARIPTDLVFRGNTITKNPAWFGKPIGVKNLVELKNARKVLFEGNDCSYSWTQGQTGYLLVLTVRNQDGRAPWATIQDVIFRNNHWAEGSAAISILGRDDIKEKDPGKPAAVGTVRTSVPMANVTITGDTFALDPLKYGAPNAKAIQIGGGPIALTIEHVRVTSASPLGSAVYFTLSPSPTLVGFRLTDVILPPSTYGMFGEAVSAAPANWTPTNPAWAKYVQNGVLGPVTITP